jgi:hypothetical protein
MTRLGLTNVGALRLSVAAYVALALAACAPSPPSAECAEAKRYFDATASIAVATFGIPFDPGVKGAAELASGAAFGVVHRMVERDDRQLAERCYNEILYSAGFARFIPFELALSFKENQH